MIYITRIHYQISKLGIGKKTKSPDRPDLKTTIKGKKDNE